MVEHLMIADQITGERGRAAEGCPKSGAFRLSDDGLIIGRDDSPVHDRELLKQVAHMGDEGDAGQRMDVLEWDAFASASCGHYREDALGIEQGAT
jgi:hypothetical protein